MLWSACSCHVAVQAQLGILQFPAVHETQAAARSRFQAALLSLAAEYKGHLLIVTHGDALGAIIEHALPDATVYQVDTAGYVRMHQEDMNSNVAVADSSGVAWLAS
jgi:broad specificity phosphatase PhoE